MTRHPSRLLCALAALGVCAWTLSAAPAADAAQKSRVIVPLGDVVNASYPAIAADDPAEFGGMFYPTPDDCGGSTAYCDVVPVTPAVAARQRPSVRALTMTVVLSFTSATGENDLDVFVYDGDPAHGYAVLASATSSANPERVALAVAEGHTYQLVVVNGAGVNTGYRLRLSLVGAFGSAAQAPTGSPSLRVSAGGAGARAARLTPYAAPTARAGDGVASPLALRPLDVAGLTTRAGQGAPWHGSGPGVQPLLVLLVAVPSALVLIAWTATRRRRDADSATAC